MTVTAEPVVQHRSFLANLLISLAPMLLLIAVWVFIARRMRAGLRSAPPSPTWPESTRSRAS